MWGPLCTRKRSGEGRTRAHAVHGAVHGGGRGEVCDDGGEGSETTAFCGAGWERLMGRSLPELYRQSGGGQTGVGSSMVVLLAVPQRVYMKWSLPCH